MNNIPNLNFIWKVYNSTISSILIVFCLTSLCFAEKVIYKDPEEDEIIQVHIGIGYATVLEFPEKIISAYLGNPEIANVEVPKNEKNVVMTTNSEKGITNLFVFTSSRRFNYKIIIGKQKDIDYIIDVRETYRQHNALPKRIPIPKLLEMAKNYNILKIRGSLKDKVFLRKEVYTEYEEKLVNIKLIEAFVNKQPHYLILHFIVQNKQTRPIKLHERDICLFINKNEIVPDYVMFDSRLLGAMEETEGWIVLKNRYISFQNEFYITLGKNTNSL